MLAVGLMSGTSADGIDLAAVELGEAGAVRVVAHGHVDYADELRARVLAFASGGECRPADLARLHAALGDAYAGAARSFMDTLSGPPDVIAVHGQTVSHLPRERVTLQLGDAARVARATGIATVADFRSADVAAGGEGAPLVPFADHVLFGAHAPIALLNIGGIANLTLLPTPSADDVIAFDTGPGNMVSDALSVRAGERFDADGRRASHGRPNEEAVREALAQPFFARRPPKSTGREEFGEAFATGMLDRVMAAGGSVEDALATAVAVTARSVAAALAGATPVGVRWTALAVAGGGARNGALVEALRAAVAPTRVRLLDEYGVPGQAREAAAFAILGAYRLRGERNTLPRATGARHAVRAGAVHLP